MKCMLGFVLIILNMLSSKTQGVILSEKMTGKIKYLQKPLSWVSCAETLLRSKLCWQHLKQNMEWCLRMSFFVVVVLCLPNNQLCWKDLWDFILAVLFKAVASCPSGLCMDCAVKTSIYCLKSALHCVFLMVKVWFGCLWLHLGCSTYSKGNVWCLKSRSSSGTENATRKFQVSRTATISASTSGLIKWWILGSLKYSWCPVCCRIENGSESWLVYVVYVKAALSPATITCTVHRPISQPLP